MHCELPASSVYLPALHCEHVALAGADAMLPLAHCLHG